ncbi:hypothetical protein ACTMU2_26160 [Cupriavidus basilensis]
MDTAVALVSDIGELNALRQSIRPMFEASPLFDAAGHCRWLEAQMARWVGTYRRPGQIELPPGEGVFFGGRWHSLPEIIEAVVAALECGDHSALENVLENISAKWSRHWLVAYALSGVALSSGRPGRRS